MRSLEGGRAQVVSFAAPPSLVMRLYEQARKEATSASDVLRRALEQYLTKQSEA